MTALPRFNLIEHRSLNVAFWLVLSVPLLCHNLAVKAQETDRAAPEENVMDPAALFEPREYAGTQGNVLKYRLLKPENYNPDEKYPLVIFLHGAGERGDDNVAQLKHAMAEFCKPERRRDYPCYVLAPQCPKGQKWADVDWSKDQLSVTENASDSLSLVFELVDRMIADAAINKNRVYITGLSMGGYGTWDALYRRPGFFAAAIPICGGGDPATAKDFKDIALWCFHGDQDKSVDVQRSRDMISALKAAGGSPKYTEYPGVGHNSWEAAYADDETYEWLFAHRRKLLSPLDSPQ